MFIRLLDIFAQIWAEAIQKTQMSTSTEQLSR